MWCQRQTISEGSVETSGINSSSQEVKTIAKRRLAKVSLKCFVIALLYIRFIFLEFMPKWFYEIKEQDFLPNQGTHGT